jgi:hypothetical protein
MNNSAAIENKSVAVFFLFLTIPEKLLFLRGHMSG